MAAPIVAYYDENGVEAVTEWNIGEIDAGSESEHKVITVWNNKGAGTNAVSHMKNVTVTAVAGDGTENSVVVSQQWIHVKVNDGADTKIGGSAKTAKVTAIGLDPDTSLIKGDTNDGTVQNAVENYAKYELWVSIPPNAPEGDKPCRIRTGYSYT